MKHREPKYFTFSKSTQWRADEDQKLLTSFDHAITLLKHLDDSVLKSINSSLNENRVLPAADEAIVKFLSKEFNIHQFHFVAFNFWSNVASIAQSKLGLVKSASACKYRHQLLKNCGYDTAKANEYFAVQREANMIEKQKHKDVLAYQNKTEMTRKHAVGTALKLRKRLSIFSLAPLAGNKEIDRNPNEIWERIKKLDDGDV